jgi:uncharacterized membrane protein
MAGIGFTLRKLVRRDDLFGMVSAHTHAAFASAGPWLFTVLALGLIGLTLPAMPSTLDFINFRIIIIYNFAFSLILAAPFYMVITRILADAIHARDVHAAPGMLLGTLVALFITNAIPAWLFYVCYVDLPFSVQLSAVINLLLVSAVWVVGVFLSALKDYMAITRAFLVGMLLAVVCATWLADSYSTVGLLNGFSIGIAYIVFSVVANILAEYHYSFERPFGFLPFMKKYWELAAAGVCYSIAMWIDKCIMWFAPEAEVLPSHMRQYPDYDSAMFLAYLTIVPSMAAFLISVETRFFEKYLKFYRDILEHANLERIEKNMTSIIDALMMSARNFVVLQGSISFVVILIASKLFEVLNINYMQLGIFRVGVIGVFFHAMFLFLTIVLAYFDARRLALLMQALYMVLNAVLTYWLMGYGFPYYGYGYFLASLIVFVVTALLTFRHVKSLPYHAFITNNQSLVKKAVRF